MSETKHTPGLLRRQEEQVEPYATVLGTKEVYNVLTVPMLTTDEAGVAEWEFNTEYAIEAWNNYQRVKAKADALEAALQACADNLQRRATVPGRVTSEILNNAWILLAAIDKERR